METPAPEIQLTEITPGMAHDWLGFNTHNRPLRSRTVTAYAADMKHSDWELNGESVKFADDGTLIDGQHRLAAIVEADVTVAMYVVRGLPRYTQDTVDGGVKRRFSDVLTLRGEKNASALAAIVRRVAIWETAGTVAARASHSPTNAQLLQVLDRYSWLRELATSASQTGAKCELPASIIGFCMWLFAMLPDAEEDTEFFFRRLADFQGLEKGHAIYELRRTLESSRSVRGERSEVFLTAITIKAWNAFRANKPVGVLSFKTGGARPEKFPQPI